MTEDLDTRLELSTIQRNHVLTDGRYCWHAIKSETKTNHVHEQFITQLKKLKWHKYLHVPATLKVLI